MTDFRDTKNKRTSVSQLRAMARQAPKLAACACAILIVVFLWPYIAYTKAERSFLNEIDKKISDGASSFPVRDVTNFEWDTVCFSYGMDGLQGALGTKELLVPKEHRDVIQKAQATSDVRLYVFAKNSSVVQTIYIPRTRHKFANREFALIGVECAKSDAGIFKAYSKGEKWILALSNKEKSHGR